MVNNSAFAERHSSINCTYLLKCVTNVTVGDVTGDSCCGGECAIPNGHMMKQCQHN